MPKKMMNIPIRRPHPYQASIVVIRYGGMRQQRQSRKKESGTNRWMDDSLFTFLAVISFYLILITQTEQSMVMILLSLHLQF